MCSQCLPCVCPQSFYHLLLECEGVELVLSFQGNNLNIEKNGQLNECAIFSQLVMSCVILLVGEKELSSCVTFFQAAL